MKKSAPVKTGKDHAETAEKLGLSVTASGLWAVRYAGEDQKLYGLTEEDVKLMLRREGYTHQAGGFNKLSEIQEFRLWCLEHRRVEHCDEGME